MLSSSLSLRGLGGSEGYSVELSSNMKVRGYLEVYIPELFRVFTYSVPAELRDLVELGSVLLVKHRKSYRLGVLVRKLDREKPSKLPAGYKVVSLLSGYKYPSWLFSLKPLIQELYFASEESFYSQFLRLGRLLEALSLKPVLLLEEPNPYFDKVLERLGIDREYPISLSEDELRERLGRRWTYYKSSLLRKGALLSYEISERLGVKRKLEELTSKLNNLSALSEGNLVNDLGEEIGKVTYKRLSFKDIRWTIKLVRALVLSGNQVEVILPERVISSPLLELVALPNELILHPYLSETERLAKLILLSRGYPMLVIGTGSAMTFPAPNLKLIVLLSESDDDHITEWGLRFNWRELAPRIAEESGAKLILMDIMPSLQSYLSFSDSSSFREALLETRDRLVHLKERIELVPPPFKRRELLTSRVLEEIRATLERGENVLIFNYVLQSLQVRCGACGYRPRCPRCGTPLKPVGSGDLFRCPLCGYQERLVKCPRCGSSSWIVRGVDLSRTYNSLRRIFPDVLLLDAYFQRRKTEVLRLADLSHAKVIIGSRAAAKLPIRFGLIVVVSLSSFFWIPSTSSRFTAVYYIANLLERLTRRGKMLVMDEDRPLSLPISTALLGENPNGLSKGVGMLRELEDWISNLGKLYADEISLRRELKLPPIYALVEVSFEEDLESDLVKGALIALSEEVRGLKIWDVILPKRTGWALTVSCPLEELVNFRERLIELFEGFEIPLEKVKINRKWEVIR